MSSDLKSYMNQTKFRLIIGSILIIFFVGDGLIFLFWGKNAAIFGLICLLAGIIPVVLIIAILWIFEWVVKRAIQE